MAEANQVETEEKADQEKQEEATSNPTADRLLFMAISLLKLVVVMGILEPFASCLWERPDAASHQKRRTCDDNGEQSNPHILNHTFPEEWNFALSRWLEIEE